MADDLTAKDVRKSEENKELTASDVYKTEFADTIGNSGMASGFSKKALGIGDKPNDATRNLDLPEAINPNTQKAELVEKPRLVARAVASSQLDKKLDLNILAEEVFAENKEGEVIGVSAQVDGRSLIGREPDKSLRYNKFDFEKPEVQRGLSDLQALDYVTGQIDRHGGNIFIDEATGQVKGIDNDMAFGATDNSQPGQGSNVNSAHELPIVMHEETAAKFKNLTPQELGDTLRGASKGDQALNDAEINKAQERLQKLQAHINTLENEGRLVGPNQPIKNFDKVTYQIAVAHEGDRSGRYASYLGRSALEYEKSGGGKGRWKTVKETESEKRFNRASPRKDNEVEKTAKSIKESDEVIPKDERKNMLRNAAERQDAMDERRGRLEQMGGGRISNGQRKEKLSEMEAFKNIRKPVEARIQIGSARGAKASLERLAQLKANRPPKPAPVVDKAEKKTEDKKEPVAGVVTDKSKSVAEIRKMFEKKSAPGVSKESSKPSLDDAVKGFGSSVSNAPKAAAKITKTPSKPGLSQVKDGNEQSL